jgi:hypothetical protein
MLLGFDAFAQTPFAALGYVEGVVSETILLTEVQDAQFAAVGAQAESLTLTDAQTVTAQFVGAQQETLTLTDAQIGIRGQFATTTENLFLTEVQNVTAQFLGAQQENITLTDVQTGLAAFIGVVNESMGVTETQSVIAAFIGNVAEQIAMIDDSAARADYVDSVLEFLSITDSQCPFGWFKIVNTQIPQWGIVDINVNEIAAYGAFTFGGVPFAGSLSLSGQANNPLPDVQIPNWTHIDDDVNTSWAEVNSNQNC